MNFQDGTWGTIKGSCTAVRDFADMCYHSYPMYLKELRNSPASLDLQPFRFVSKFPPKLSQKKYLKNSWQS